MLWLYITILSYLLFSGANILDRYILRGPLRHPSSYAFYIGVSGLFAIFLIPFNFRIPPVNIIGLSFLVGVVSLTALYFLYKGIYEGNVSTQVPMVGALAPLSTLIFSFLLAGEKFNLTIQGFAAFFALIIGIILLSGHVKIKEFRLGGDDIFNAIIAGAFFGLAFVLIKFVFESEDFINGYIWTRAGGVLAALSILAFPGARKIIFRKNPIRKTNLLIPLVANRVLGAAGNMGQNFAVSLATFGQVAFISALAGIQHLGILVMAALFAIKRPDILEETFTRKILIWRFVGILFIGIGIYLLLT